MVTLAEKLWFEILNSQTERGTHILFKIFYQLSNLHFFHLDKIFLIYISISMILIVGKVTSRIWVLSGPQTCALRL